MENESAWAAEQAELQALAENIITEHVGESEENLFKLMEELKKEVPGGEVGRLMGDWSQKKRILLQDAIYWALPDEARQAYLEYIK